MKTLEIECNYCKTKFEKPKKEVDRQRKNGREYFYCSRSCSGKGNIKTSLKNFDGYIGNMLYLPINKPDELTPFRSFLRRIKNRHKEKGIEVDICLDDLKTVWDKQDGICAITKVPLLLEKTVSNPNYSASIDRINSNEGYTRKNIQYISVTTNYAKNKYSLETINEYFNIVKDLGGDLDSIVFRKEVDCT